MSNFSLSGFEIMQQKQKPKAPQMNKAKKSRISASVSSLCPSSEQELIKVQSKSHSGRSIKPRMPWSPSKPGPSGLSSNILANLRESDSSDEEDSEACCVCKQSSPPALQQFSGLKIVNWAKCSNISCGHWVHLQFCHERVTVGRTEMFSCPCCPSTQSEQ